MPEDLLSALRSLPDRIEVPTAPLPSEIRRRGTRRKLIRRAVSGISIATLVAVIAVTPAWDSMSDRIGFPPVGGGEQQGSDGFLLSSGGGGNDWELRVDAQDDDNLCFHFSAADASPQSWCDESMGQGGLWRSFHTFRPESPEKIVFGALSPEVATLHYNVVGSEHPEREADYQQTVPAFPDEDTRFFVIIYGPENDLALRVTNAEGDDLDRLTVPATPTFARFPLTYGRGERKVNGMLEIDARAGRVCSSAYLPWARAAQLHHDATDAPPDAVIVTLFEPPQRFRSDLCVRNQNPLVLLRTLDAPRDYYVDYHEQEDGGRRAVARLGSPSQSDIDP